MRLIRPRGSAYHPAYVLAIVFALTAVLLVLFIEGLFPFQDPAVGWARSRNWTSWLAHTAAVVGLAAVWWTSGGDLWGGVIFGNALNLGHEAGQKLYGEHPWANLDTAMDLLLPLTVSVGLAWWLGVRVRDRKREESPVTPSGDPSAEPPVMPSGKPQRKPPVEPRVD